MFLMERRDPCGAWEYANHKKAALLCSPTQAMEGLGANGMPYLGSSMFAFWSRRASNYNGDGFFSGRRVHHLLFPREGIVPRLADSPLLEVYSCRTGQHTGQSTWHHWTCPVRPVDKLLLFLPPTHSLLQKFRNCLLISALSGSSHINSPLLKSYPLLGLNHVPPKLIFESLLLMALLGDSIIADDLVGESGITVV